MDVYATGYGNEGNVMLCLRCRVSAKELAVQPYSRCDRGVGNEWRLDLYHSLTLLRKWPCTGFRPNLSSRSVSHMVTPSQGG